MSRVPLCLTFMLLLVTVSCGHSQIVTQPEKDFVTLASNLDDFVYLPKGDAIYRLDLDLYGDGKPTIFLTFNLWGTKGGYNWIAYTPTKGGYNRVVAATDGSGIVFRTDGVYSYGKIAGYSDRGGL